MELSANTKVHDLLSAYPFLEEFLSAYHPRFQLLGSKTARATIGRVATLGAAAGIAGVEPQALLAAVAAEIERRTGTRPGQAVASGLSREQRLGILKKIISDLHAGGDLESARQRFAQAVGDVEASEIAAMEEELIRGGLPVADVQRLCDVHVGAFREALDEHAGVHAPPGHPVHTYLAANRVISELANRLGALAREAERGSGPEGSGQAPGGAEGSDGARGSGAILEQAAQVLDGLAGVENHYQRKENQLFPFLERHDVTGPSQVMWGVHDEIRAQLKTVREAVRRGDSRAFATGAPRLARDLVEMIYKEEKILLPMAIDTLSNADWAEVRRGEDVLGYVLAQPAAPWPAGAESAARAADAMAAVSAAGTASPAGAAASASTAGGASATRTAGALGQPGAEALLELATGALTREQIDLLLTHLPVDISFVDETDTVRYYSEGKERIFPRSPGVIGRQVQKCHPPKSVDVVEQILAAFRAGTKDVAEFWIEMQGRFIHIRYYAMRDAAGAYRGCLEVSQDVTGIRALTGQRRLLDWE